MSKKQPRKFQFRTYQEEEFLIFKIKGILPSRASATFIAVMITILIMLVLWGYEWMLIGIFNFLYELS